MGEGMQDVEARALRAAEERYALALEAAGQGHWDWDVATGAVFVSERAQAILGLEPGPVLRQRAAWLEAIRCHPDDEARLRQSGDDLVTGTATGHECEWRVLLDDGTPRWVKSRGVCIRDANGRAVRVAGTVADVDSEKRILRDLEILGERYAFADAAGSGHLDWIVATDEFYGSPRFLEICGLPPSSRLGTRADFIQKFPFFPPERDEVVGKFTALFASRATRLELDMRYMRGHEVRWLHISGVCTRDVDGALLRWTSSITDITDLKRAEEALAKSEERRRLAQKMDAIGTLAGGIAHDFNNILGSVLGYAEMALRDAPQGSRLRRDLESIVSAGERGQALVDRILAFSRSGLAERVPVHVDDVVREALHLLNVRMHADTRIETDLQAGTAAVEGDASQVHQIVTNLVTNAIHAMTSGGTLSVRSASIRIDAARDVTVGALSPGEYIRLEVADSGTGMPAELLDRIFDPFFTTREVGVGTGLGLSLVHGIVMELGGAIDVASTLGTGSTFAIYLPRSGDAPQRPHQLDDASHRGSRQRVLIVDDEEPLVRLTAETLQGLGYATASFTSSLAAFEAFRENPGGFDVVITDERMPLMSGSALTRKIRCIDKTVPVVLVSGNLSAAAVAEAHRAGVSQILKKPVRARDLSSNLAQLLSQR